MYDDYVYHTEEQNKSLNQLIGKKLEFGQYRKSRIGRVFLYWPIFSILAEFVISIMRADLAIQILY